eukprot:SAG22_NODE_13757_length_396_cov_0.606061_1_plen_83_part_01
MNYAGAELVCSTTSDSANAARGRTADDCCSDLRPTTDCCPFDLGCSEAPELSVSIYACSDVDCAGAWSTCAADCSDKMYTVTT